MGPLVSIIAEILQGRLEQMKLLGAEFGHPVPQKRSAPLTPFLRDPAVICEIKKRSPSRGDIDASLDVVAQAGLYRDGGIRTVSVLTEEARFGGSLADLMKVKTAYPDMSVLRKDFLATPEDIEVSYRAGADAILLIAGMLEEELLESLYLQARGLGLAVLVEVHAPEDVRKAQIIKPRFTGINCRDLSTFALDPLLPLRVKDGITWRTKVVFESGIFTPQQADWAVAAGFQSLLVGEGAVRDKSLAPRLAQGFRPFPQPSFWARLAVQKSVGRPLVKICGLTRWEDVALADELGADLLGFVLTESPRRVTARWVSSLRGTRALKVGVVSLGPGEKPAGEVLHLLEEGSLDALQFHGGETPSDLEGWLEKGYKAICPQSAVDLTAWDGPWPPRILIDAYLPGQAGGTGKRVDDALIGALKGKPLWLAGGLNPDNVAQVVRAWRPELVDASSGLESSPGIKDHDKLRRYFEEIAHAL